MSSVSDELGAELAKLGSKRGAGEALPRAHARASLREQLFGAPSERLEVGRFVLLAKVGEGGMGVVFSAYDRELDRKVAIKVLRSAEPDQAERLLREAKTMARLSHPNVVPIYEAGRTDAQLYLAMEYVDGGDLRDWWTAESRHWTEIRDKLVEAGRGLEAAHEVGIIHRDFKPQNVLIGRDGRVRVGDFGLARAISPSTATRVEETATPQASAIDSTEADALQALASDHDYTLTRTGTILGTPAYIAPELFDGGRADVRSDVFAFCVTAYEAFFGKRPHRGDTLQTLIEAARAGRVLPMPSRSEVPRSIRRALYRGLAPDPQERFGSIRAVLTAFEPGPRRRRRGLALGLVGAAAAGATMTTLGQGDSGTTLTPCTGARTAWDEVWTQGRASALSSSLSSGLTTPFESPPTAVLDALDEYGERWIETHTEACRATRVHGERSEALLDRSMLCLERSSRRVSALLDLVIEQEAVPSANVLDAVEDLPRPEQCTDESFLASTVAPPEDPELAENVEVLADRLDEARSLDALGRRDEARALRDELEVEARNLGYAPLLTEVLYALREFDDSRPDLEARIREGLLLAESTGDTRNVVLGWKRLAILLGDLGRFDAAREAGEHAAAFLEQLGGDPWLERELWHAMGEVAIAAADWDVGIQHFERAIATERELGHLESRQLVGSITSLGTLYSLKGDDELARECYEEAWALASIFGEPLDPILMLHMGRINAHEDRFDDSSHWYGRAYDLILARDGYEHPLAALLLSNTGQNHCDAGYCYESIPLIDRSIRMLTNLLGPQTRQLMRMRRGLAEIYMLADDYERAIEEAELALEVARATVGDEHPEMGRTLDRLGHILLASGQPEAARAPLHRAVEVFESTQEPSSETGRARFRLARASWEAGRQTEALEHARKAHDELASVDDSKHLPELRQWLARHAGDEASDTSGGGR